MKAISNVSRHKLMKCAVWREKKLPEGINFLSITGLRKEAREKLQKIRPENVGQASRISGVSPADISVLLIYLASGQKRKDACQSNPTTQQEGGSRYD